MPGKPKNRGLNSDISTCTVFQFWQVVSYIATSACMLIWRNSYILSCFWIVLRDLEFPSSAVLFSNFLHNQEMILFHLGFIFFLFWCVFKHSRHQINSQNFFHMIKFLGKLLLFHYLYPEQHKNWWFLFVCLFWGNLICATLNVLGRALLFKVMFSLLAKM